jgi:sugar O-acyltransferase (sialic acid O-acetyltransferase NeuD family)
MIDLVIVGAGGFARELYYWTMETIKDRSQECRVKGFLSVEPDLLDEFALPVGILGDESSYEIQPNDQFVIGIGTVGTKSRVIEELQKKDAKFFSLIHPTAVVSPSAILGEGVVICPFAVVSANVAIGDFSMMNIYSSAGHDARIGRQCVLSPYATLNGSASIDNDVFLGTHSTVLASKTVGQGAQVSAGGLVVRNIPPGHTLLSKPGPIVDNR